jgi:quercetin dioxygenase-like cupin family protein
VTCGGAAFGSGAQEAAGSDTEKRPPILLDGGEGEPIAFPIHPTLRLADPESNVAGMSFFEVRIPAGAPGAPPHTHTNEDEFFYVREGTITFMANDERRTLGPGGFILLPRHSLHAMWNTSDEDAILLVGTSAGSFGDFFDAVAMEVRESDASTPAEVGAILGRLGAERGIIIDMSKVPEDVAALYGM